MRSLAPCFVWRTRTFSFSASWLLRRLSPRFWIISLLLLINWSFLFYKVIIDSFCKLITHLLPNSFFLVRCSSFVPWNKLLRLFNRGKFIYLNEIDLDWNRHWVFMLCHYVFSNSVRYVDFHTWCSVWFLSWIFKTSWTFEFRARILLINVFLIFLIQLFSVCLWTV